MSNKKEEYQQILNEAYKALINSDEMQFSSILKRDADLLANRVLMNAHSINQLLKGTTFTLPNMSELSLIDISSMVSLLRTQVEAYAAFNHIFINESEDEIKLYYNLWCLSGLSERTHIEIDEEVLSQADIKEFKARKNKEEQEIIVLKKSILNNEFVKTFPKPTIDKLYKHINKFKPKWEVKIVDNKLESIRIKGVLLNTGIKKEIFKDVYSLLSWYSHPK